MSGDKTFTEKAGEKVHELKDYVGETVESTVEWTKDKFGYGKGDQAQDKAKDAGEDFKDAARLTGENIKEKAEGFRDQCYRGKEEVGRKVEGAGQELQGGKTLTEKAGDKIHEIKDYVGDTVESTVEWTKDKLGYGKGDQAQDKAKEGWENTKDAARLTGENLKEKTQEKAGEFQQQWQQGKEKVGERLEGAGQGIREATG